MGEPANVIEWEADAIVRRYCADHTRPQADGEACLEALKQFMVVCARGDGIRAPSEPIDDMWHTALLFTRSYRDFCSERLGTFVHHEPVDERASVDVYARTKAEAEALFGELDARFWTSVESVARCGGCGSIYQP